MRWGYYTPIDITQLPTVKEIKEKYKGCRELVIETHPIEKDKVVAVSYRIPCEMCGKYHRFGSKAEIKCLNKMWSSKPSEPFDEYECPCCEGTERINYDE